MLAQPMPQPTGRTRPFRFGLEHRPERQAPLPAGTMIGDRFRVIGLIGEGGMGRVYSAEHVFLRRKVALKLLRAEARGDGENVARFQQEALASSSIGHPNIVEIVDFAALSDGQVYMAMELLEGESLEQWLDRPGGALLDLLEPLAQVADGLEAAHEVGVFHRDIKPANVFLVEPDPKGRNPDVRAKLVDFGIAKITSRETGGFRTDAGTVLGTPYYLAPERCAGHAEDGRADLYSLGVILYEALTGRLPFDASTFMGILVHHMKTQPLDPRQAAPSRAIPDALAQLTNELLAKNPDDRPANAAAVARRIREVLRTEREALAGFFCGPQGSVGGAGEATQRLGEGTDPTRRLDPVQTSAGPMMSFAARAVDPVRAQQEPKADLEEPPPSRSWVFVLVVFAVLGVAAALVFVELSGGLARGPSRSPGDAPNSLDAQPPSEPTLVSPGSDPSGAAPDADGEPGPRPRDSDSTDSPAADGRDEGGGGETSGASPTPSEKGGSKGPKSGGDNRPKDNKPNAGKGGGRGGKGGDKGGGRGGGKGSAGDSAPKPEPDADKPTGPTIKDDIYDE